MAWFVRSLFLISPFAHFSWLALAPNDRAPAGMDEKQRTVLVGFEDGVVRTLKR